MARLVCAVTVAGRKLGAADDDVAGVLSVAGACFLAGVAVFAGALGTASARETWCLWAEDDDVSFLVEEEDFLWDEWVVVAAVVDACAAFLTGVAAVVLAAVEAWCFVSFAALAAFSVVDLVLDVVVDGLA